MKSNFGIFPSTFLPFGGIVLAGKAREVRWFHQTFRGKSPTKCFWNGWLFSANLDLKGNLDQVVLEDIVVKALPQYIYKRIIHEYVFHTSPLLIIVIIIIFMNMLFIPHHPYMDQVLQAVASVGIDWAGRSEENPEWFIEALWQSFSQKIQGNNYRVNMKSILTPVGLAWEGSLVLGWRRRTPPWTSSQLVRTFGV